MNTSTNSGFESLDWAPPWQVDRPTRARPPAGPEREAWLEHGLLFRASRTLKAVLDRIDPAIARNEPIATLDEEAVTIALLEFLESAPSKTTAKSATGRMPLHKARVFFSYFARGFRRYCKIHGLREPRLPLIQEFSLEEGALQADTFDSLREYRRCVRTLIAEIERRVIAPSAKALSPEEAATLIVCSGALFGGLARKDHREALVSALSRSLHSDGRIVWFWLDRPSPYRWIADPVTEALLRRLWERGIVPLPEGTKVTPKSIRLALGGEAGADSVAADLEHAVRAAHVRHFAPDAASVAQGLIPNTPLADEPWLRLISGTRHPADRAKAAISIPRIVPAVQADTLQQVAIDEIIDAIAAAVRWDPKAQRRQGTESTAEELAAKKYSADARRALRACKGRLEQLYVRAGHPESHSRSFAYGLLCYAEDLLELGGLKIRQLAPGTISNYVGIVRNHLASLHVSDLVELGTEARADAYRKGVRRQLVRDRTTHRTAFEGFERSILRHIDLTDEVDWATIPGRARQRHLPRADANLVAPGLYRHVFESLAAPARENPIVELARALLVILYRFGLRTGEAAEVTAGALLLHSDGRASLRVTHSELTSRKSANALRLVGPVELPADEVDFLADYRDQRVLGAARRGRDRAETYLFATGSTNKLEHVEPAQELLIEMLRAASGDTHLRPRHLRHTFVSRLYLCGRDQLGCLDPVAPAPAGDAWWRTFATGHSSPDTGIVSYTHVNEVAHYHYACQVVSEEAPLSFLSQLAGNDARSLERSRLRSSESTVSELFLQSLRKNIPCTNLPNALTHRIAYLQLQPQRDTGPTGDDTRRLTWNDAWDVYANARVGRTSSDMSEHAGIIRRRVRDLEMQERIVRRVKRRPQLDPEEQAVAAAIWQVLPRDPDLQAIITSVVDWLRPRGRQILMPADFARALEQRLTRAGLTKLQSRAASSRRRWLWCPDESGDHSTGWLELLAFLYSGSP